MLAYDRNIMIVPFRGEFMVPDALDVIDDFRPLPTSYALNLDEHNIKHIKDFVFLEVIVKRFFHKFYKNKTFFFRMYLHLVCMYVYVCVYVCM